MLRTGTSSLFDEITDETLVDSTHDPETLAFLCSAAMRSALLVPIKIRERILGVMALGSVKTMRRYDPSDVALAEELGRRAGLSLENAQLYAAAQLAAARAEKAAEHAEAAARVAEKASRAKDEFLATVSHELRTPLSAILGWSTILKDRVTDASFAKPLEVIHRNAQAQVKIIDDILDVSRVIAGKFRLEPKPADLVTIARDAIEVVRPSATAKRLNLTFSSTNEVCLLMADPERLQQAAWNILSNAIKFTEPGGRIDVHVAQMGGRVEIAVADTGKGIDPEFLPHVFEQFRQADSTTTRRVGGLGLGMALVRHIVELHGGSVMATSPGIGMGSTFTIKLPVRALIPPSNGDSPPPPPLKRSDPPVADRLRGVRILLVDDEIDGRDVVATVLLAQGAEVEMASSAVEGFAMFRRFHPDVVVSDIGMPDEDGYSFIRRIRSLPAAQGGRIPSLALTAFATEEDRMRALDAGFTSHVGKPVDPGTLVSALARLSALTVR